MGPWARTHGPQGLPARGRRAGGRRRGSPWGPWARAHGPMISAYFKLFVLISAYLETDSCLFQIIWTLISAYLSLFEFISAYFGLFELISSYLSLFRHISAYFGLFGSLFRLIWPKK